MSDQTSTLRTAECFCGADIVQEQEGGEWHNLNDGGQGTALYCYPDEEGADGEAMHEPFEVFDE